LKNLGSILNNDIDNILYAITSGPTAAEEYRQAVGHLLDTQPGVLAQNVGMPDPVLYPSQVATGWQEYHTQVTLQVWPDQGPNEAAHEEMVAKQILAAGTDPLTITIEACRQRQIPVLASYRMNAEDFYQGQLELYDFGRRNRHLAIPGRHCLNPAHPEVYEHRMEIFEEVAREYDIDGIEFDFRRWTSMISDPLRNHPILTRMVRQTRDMLDAVARTRGRERLILGARVGPTIAGEPLGENEMSCRDLGLDVATWVREGLVDYLCPCYFWGHNPGDDPHTAEFAELASAAGVGIYPTVFPYSRWQAENPDETSIDLDRPDLMRRFRDDVVKAALKCYDEGADGVSSYNWVPHHQPGMTARNIRSGWGLGSARLQMHIHTMLKDEARLRGYLASDEMLPE